MKRLRLRNKDEPILINIPTIVLFHFSKKHSDHLLSLRTWIATKALLEKQGNWADTNQVMVAIGIKKFKSFKRKLKQSGLFRNIDRKKIFPITVNKIINKHKLNHGYIKIRVEKINTVFFNNLTSNKKLSSYITKIYFENDLRSKSRLTHGRISISKASEDLNIGRTTIINNLKVAKAKKIPNIRQYKHLKINESYGKWLLCNEMIIPDKQINKRIGDNFNYYFEYKTPQGSYLAARYPNIFHFTGVTLKVVSKRPSKQHHC